MENQKLHPSTTAILQFFEYKHLPEHLQVISKPFYIMAWELAWDLNKSENGAELTAGLRKLLEAKDCMVRCALGLPK